MRAAELIRAEPIEGGLTLVTYGVDITPECAEEGESVGVLLHGARGTRSWHVTISEHARWGNDEVVLSADQFAAVVRLAIQAGVTVL